MSASLLPSYLIDERVVWGRLFGGYIGTIRKNAGLSVEEAARLSGMEASEWMAVEEGTVPQDINRLRAMADAMQVSLDSIGTLVLVCRAAWEL
jgi:transcriptional regulator with XRE-family HTH domain